MTERIIAHGYVVTLDPQRRVIADGAVALRGNTIVAVGPSAEVLAEHSGEVLDAGDGLILPGLIDAHNHPILGIYGGSPPAAAGHWPQPRANNAFSLGGDITGLLRYLATPFGSALTPEQAYISAMYTFASQLKAGITCFNDGGGAHGATVAQAVVDSGIRGIVTSQSGDLLVGEDGRLQRCADADLLLAETEALHARWHGAAAGRLRIWANLLYPVGCSDELCCGMHALAERLDTGLAAHVAALPNEAEFSLQQHGERPLTRLANLGVFGPQLQAIHMGHPSDAEIELLARHDVNIAHCPSSATFSAHGCISTGQFPKMAAAGLSIGIGNDSGAAMWYQLAATASFHKDVTHDMQTFDVPTVMEMATIQGARSCCWDAEIGSLEPGKRADLCVIDRSGWHWQLAHDPVQAFVQGYHPNDVRTVLVDGQVLVQDGRLTMLDEERLRHDIAAVSRALYA